MILSSSMTALESEWGTCSSDDKRIETAKISKDGKELNNKWDYCIIFMDQDYDDEFVLLSCLSKGGWGRG